MVSIPAHAAIAQNFPNCLISHLRNTEPNMLRHPPRTIKGSLRREKRKMQLLMLCLFFGVKDLLKLPSIHIRFHLGQAHILSTN